MKTQNIIFLIIISMVFAISCQEKPTVTYTIKGKLLKNCGGEVMANAEMLVATQQSLPMHQNTLYKKFTSDSEGNFFGYL